MSIIDFYKLRSDWYGGTDFMARALQRQIRSGKELTTFVHFPRQWIPIFEWAGAPWRTSTEPGYYVPFVSGMDETNVVEEVDAARRAGQLRLLVETLASCDTILCETLQRIDTLAHKPSASSPSDADCGKVFLTNWHSYSRSELRSYEEALKGFRQRSENAIFLPCGRRRPYISSPTHRRVRIMLEGEGLSIQDHDTIVLTSIGPVPEPLWSHPVVMNYDTAVRDIYRVLTLLRRLLHGVSYRVGWDCLCFRPYRDILQIVGDEGCIRRIVRPKGLCVRNIPTYRVHAARRV